MYINTYPDNSAGGADEGDRISAVLLERFKSFHPKSIDLSLGRMRRLLKALGQPRAPLAPGVSVVRVFGTSERLI